ncbi:Alpha/Beta hydrolase protein [Mycena belliarum]|uniref:Alpha/Beta hydrolase protein n=1 Tax=Mycena belliarum TaxID=1033014 RepID=A0AAD6XTE1_9AGAR|nr:Alpha/Beta hydrolase protein [Mycena belliae]
MKQTTVIIAGLNVHTYATESFASSIKPILALFVLHGRLGSTESPYIQDLIAALVGGAADNERERDLLVVAFDHRNHGTRLRAQVANLDFKDNPNHVHDMYSVQTGTAKDVSFVMDFLPAYLFTSGERSIVEWGVAGVSLGGHSTWIAAAEDPRVKIAIPIIGCPDYLGLMGLRAEAQGIAIAPPHFPESLLRVIRASTPTGLPYTSKEDGNPFLGKKVLILSGANDPLVPWSASEKFVKGLEVGSGSKEVIVQPGAGHEVTPEMVMAAVAFILRML